MRIITEIKLVDNTVVCRTNEKAVKNLTEEQYLQLIDALFRQAEEMREMLRVSVDFGTFSA